MGPLNYTDFYKTDHRRQYPKGTSLVYSNWTPRGSRIKGIDKIVVFGLQPLLTALSEDFQHNFFNQDKEYVVKNYKRRLDNALGIDAVPMDHIEELHDLGYLPIKVKALPEGSLCPLRVSCMTIVNTKPEFFWIVNFLETIISNSLWGPMNSATIANQYRIILDKYAELTSDIPEFVDWQAHDFSMRGMFSLEAACMSGAGHLLSFTGTDTIPAIDYLEEYYGADSDKELIGGSVPATEHSVMCLGAKETEIETFKRLITEVYPSGVVSIVSDTWDFWKVLTEYLPALKDIIMGRDGKVVIRPDSGDPADIICGIELPDNVLVHRFTESQLKGAIELLWDTFGGTLNSKGYKQLDSHIGLIYGDAITLERADEICRRLQAKGFASTNVVFGVGSYTYQYNTRDTFGFAMKATYGEIDGEPQVIFKDPVTDSGLKKSAVGLLKVNEDYTLTENCTWEEENTGLLQTVYLDGAFVAMQDLQDIRTRLKEGRKL